MGEVLELPILLASVHRQLSDELAERSGADVSALAQYQNVLRGIDRPGVTERTIALHGRISTRVAATGLGRAVRRDQVAVGDGTKAKRLYRLTAAGEDEVATWQATIADADSTWRSSPLAGALRAFVAGLPFELSHHPASYGAADPSATGAPFVQNDVRTARQREAGEPAHGTDWRAVRRDDDGAGVVDLPTVALASQALMAFVVDYEDRFPWPLTSTLNVVRHLRPEPIPLEDVPVGHGLIGNGRTLLERHLIVDVDGGRAKLTDRGCQVVERHPRRMAATEQLWRDRHGDDVVNGLVAAAHDVVDGPSSGPIRIDLWSG